MCDSDKANESAKKKSDSACDSTTPDCPPKEKKKFKCTVEFRPKDDWKGEYGFDWMRIGGPGEKAGEDVYKTAVVSGNGGLTAAQAYTAMKLEYGSMATEIKVKDPENLAEYFIPYLNIFPKDIPAVVGIPTPLFEAELKILIAVEDNAPEKIELEYDKALFDIKADTIADKAVNTKRVASDGTLKITCKTKLDSDQDIKVHATLDGVKKQVGQLKVMKNNDGARKTVKIVFVKVETNVNGTPRTGSISEEEKTNLRNSLSQALVLSIIEDGPNFDLKSDDKFKIKTVSGTKVYGKFIYKKKGTDGANRVDGGLYEDLIESPSTKADALFKYVHDAYVKIAGNEKYETGKYITVFAFDEIPYDVTTYGQVQDIGVHNVLLFAPVGGRKATTLAHETLHGLGLYHTHDSPGATNKYIFTSGKTDNIMSYSNSRTSTWHRQWIVIQSGL